MATASALAVALLAVLVVATPAQAAGEVEVAIDGLSDSMRVGEVDDFRATFTNKSGESISGVFAVVAVSLPGTPPEAIYVQRTSGGELPREVIGDGSVVFTDGNPFDLGRGGGNGRRRIEFSLAFASGTPDGEAVITVAAYAGGELLGSASRTVEMRGGTTTPPNTDPGIVPTFEAGQSYSIAPIPEAAVTPQPDSKVPTTVYVLGTMLAVTGLLTLILTFWAPGRRFAAEGGPGWTGGPGPDGRRPMVWPGRTPASAGPVAPRPATPAGPGPGGPLASGGPQQWPVVTRSSAAGRPPAYPGPGTGATPPVHDPGPPTGTGRAVRGAGPATGTGRAIRDPGPPTGGGARRDAVPEDPWRYD